MCEEKWSVKIKRKKKKDNVNTVPPLDFLARIKKHTKARVHSLVHTHKHALHQLLKV